MLPSFKNKIDYFSLNPFGGYILSIPSAPLMHTISASFIMDIMLHSPPILYASDPDGKDLLLCPVLIACKMLEYSESLLPTLSSSLRRGLSHRR